MPNRQPWSIHLVKQHHLTCGVVTESLSAPLILFSLSFMFGSVVSDMGFTFPVSHSLGCVIYHALQSGITDL